jgi:CRP-like cAMP-binding protein
MNDLSCYQKVFLFQDLDLAALEDVLALTVPRDFVAGAVIIREGEPGDSMFIMGSGEVEITKALTLVLEKDTPKERVMLRLRAEDGGCFGEMALLENEVRSATVQAITPCRLLELQRDDFLGYVKSHPQVGCQLLLRLAQRLSAYLRRTNQDLVKLTTALAIALGG